MRKYLVGGRIVNDFNLNARWDAALHEAAHAIVARVVDLPVISAAVAADGYNGLVLFGTTTKPLYSALVHASGEPGARLNALFERPEAPPFAAALLLEDDYPLEDEARECIIRAGQIDDDGDDESSTAAHLADWAVEVEGGSEASDEEKQAFVDKLAASIVTEWREKIFNLAEVLYFRGALCGQRLEAFLSDVQPFGGPVVDLQGRAKELRYTPDGVFITGPASLAAASGDAGSMVFAAAGDVHIEEPAAAMA